MSHDAARSLSSGAHSRDPVARNDDWEGRVRCLPLMLAVHVVDHDTQKRIKDGVMVGVRTTITY